LGLLVGVGARGQPEILAQLDEPFVEQGGRAKHLSSAVGAVSALFGQVSVDPGQTVDDRP
jgi:hypothetical protein